MLQLKYSLCPETISSKIDIKIEKALLYKANNLLMLSVIRQDCFYHTYKPFIQYLLSTFYMLGTMLLVFES